MGRLETRRRRVTTIVAAFEEVRERRSLARITRRRRAIVIDVSGAFARVTPICAAQNKSARAAAAVKRTREDAAIERQKEKMWRALLTRPTFGDCAIEPRHDEATPSSARRRRHLTPKLVNDERAKTNVRARVVDDWQLESDCIRQTNLRREQQSARQGENCEK